MALSVDDIAALTDAEIDRCPDGPFKLPVDAYSRPLNLEHLDARLQQRIPASDGVISPPHQPYTIERSRLPTIDPAIGEREDEIKAYHKLAQDGGHPVYPIDLLDTMYKNAEDCRKLLHPWLRGEGPGVALIASCGSRPETIFGRQWMRWQDF
ncbi:hypothetical protein F5B18DRAFT_666247 [Nemania serpens]|nr:hypothetical protein F5B18DRAFT_666247 [Nemania serpens]